MAMFSAMSESIYCGHKRTFIFRNAYISSQICAEVKHRLPALCRYCLSYLIGIPPRVSAAYVASPGECFPYLQTLPFVYFSQTLNGASSFRMFDVSFNVDHMGLGNVDPKERESHLADVDAGDSCACAVD